MHTGLSWARIVFTFCRFWISHTWWVGGQEPQHQPCCPEPRPQCAWGSPTGPTHNDSAVCGAAVQLAPGEAKLRCQGRRH